MSALASGGHAGVLAISSVKQPAPGRDDCKADWSGNLRLWGKCANGKPDYRFEQLSALAFVLDERKEIQDGFAPASLIRMGAKEPAARLTAVAEDGVRRGIPEGLVKEPNNPANGLIASSVAGMLLS
jgi:hypothetical protein